MSAPPSLMNAAQDASGVDYFSESEGDSNIYPEGGNAEDNNTNNNQCEDDEIDEFPVHTYDSETLNDIFYTTTHKVPDKDMIEAYISWADRGTLLFYHYSEYDCRQFKPYLGQGDIRKLGHLQHLPNELLQMIVSEMDIDSLTRFRRTSRSARALAQENLDWRLVSEHAKTQLLALIDTDLAWKFTVAQLAAKLQQFECDTCPRNHGFLLFLPALVRCCPDCLPRDPKFTVWKKSAIKRRPLRPEQREVALKTLELPNVDPEEDLSFRVAPWYYPRPADRLHVRGPEHPLLHQGTSCNRDIMRRDFRFFATVYIPYFDRRTREIVNPRQCIGCHIKAGKGPEEVLNMPWYINIAGPNVYSRDTYLEHFRTCEYAHRVGELVQQGMVVVEPTPRTQVVVNRHWEREREIDSRQVTRPPDPEEEERLLSLWLRPRRLGDTEDDPMTIDSDTEVEAGTTDDTPDDPMDTDMDEAGPTGDTPDGPIIIDDD